MLSIIYVKTNFSNGIDFVVTAETSGEAIMTGTDVNASASFYPRSGVHDTSGAARLYAAAGTAVAEPVTIANDRVKIIVSSGGNATTGTFYIVVG